MSDQSGAPVFTDVDEVLAERIIGHTRRSMDQSPQHDSETPGAGATQNTATAHPMRHRGLFLAIVAAAVLLFLIILSRRKA